MYADQTSTHYMIDADQRIIAAGGAWDRFACDNQAPDLDEVHVRGRSLWDYIHGDDIRRIYRMLMSHVRSTGRPVTVPFRCDSPTLRRYMELIITPCPDHAVAFDTRLVRTEQRPYQPVLDPSVRRLPSTSLLICAWCKRVNEPDGWVEIEQSPAVRKHLAGDAAPSLDHTICPDCRGTMLRLAGGSATNIG